MEKEQRLEAVIERLEAEVTRLQAQYDDLCIRGIPPIKIGTKRMDRPVNKGDFITVEYIALDDTKHEFKYMHVDPVPCRIDALSIYIIGEGKYVGVFNRAELSPAELRFVEQAHATEVIEVRGG